MDWANRIENFFKTGTLVSDTTSFIRDNCSETKLSTIIVESLSVKTGYLVKAVALAAERLKKSKTSCKRF